MKTDFYRHFTVIIGDVDAPECCRTLRTENRYLPAILTELGVFPSVGQIWRNGRDLMREAEGDRYLRKVKS
ncbi:hypothetical protein ACTP13_19305 [Paenibacillus peoriae]|uniref:hypothetical protein n=1 Tax=Paenibacillus peoriae TaxID=59893 RepID=UPI003F97D9BE